MAQKRRSPPKKKFVSDSSDSDSCPNSPVSINSEDEVETSTMQEWSTLWLAQQGAAAQDNWTLGAPKFKFCKKRKEYFTDRFDVIWYKAPYKYNALLNFTHNATLDRSPLVQASLSIIFEDGTPIDVNTDDGLPSISKTESIFRARQTGTVGGREVKLGPFQFNVCSYKYDSKRFRLVLNFYLVESENGNDIKEADLQDDNVGANFVHMCTMTSPAFLIKAKKPIAKPGIKSKKRSLEVEEKPRQAEISLSPVNTASLPSMEINHIPIPASYSNSMQLDISTLSSLPMETQKRFLESQLLSFNSIINNMAQGMGHPPLEAPKKKTRHEARSHNNTSATVIHQLSGYLAPQLCAQPFYYDAPQMVPTYHHQQVMFVEEPFHSLEILNEEESEEDLFNPVDYQQQGIVFDGFDTFPGPQLVDLGNDFFL
jgi:hypothetical protein